jgi:hypothetical protein
MAKKPKFTPAQIKEHIKKIQDAIEKQKAENRGEYFTSITPEGIKNKLKRVNSPMIISQGWSGAQAGGTIPYALGIHNPDSTVATRLFAHVWVGSGNIDPIVSTFLLNVDTNFPRLTQPAMNPFAGLVLPPGASATLSFALNVPAVIEPSNYMGNSCLMQLNFEEVIGKYLDRAVFVFPVL